MKVTRTNVFANGDEIIISLYDHLGGNDPVEALSMDASTARALSEALVSVQTETGRKVELVEAHGAMAPDVGALWYGLTEDGKKQWVRWAEADNATCAEYWRSGRELLEYIRAVLRP